MVPGPAMPPAASSSFWSLRLVVDGPLHVVVGLDERLQHHLAVAPVLELVAGGRTSSERMVGASVIVDVLLRWYV